LDFKFVARAWRKLHADDPQKHLVMIKGLFFGLAAFAFDK